LTPYRDFRSLAESSRHIYQADMDLRGGSQTRPHGTHFYYVDAIGQVNLMVKNMLTRSTRHGLTARLECNANQDNSWFLA
jgi:hypothetical protein